MAGEATTTECVRKLFEEDPTRPLVSIAKEVGVSRQWVSMIYRGLGLKRVKKPTRCLVTGCKRPYEASGYCPMHKMRVRRHGEPGPVESYRREKVDITCHVCGTRKKLGASRYRARSRNRRLPFWFCSRRCFGRYAGKRWGWGRNHKNEDTGVRV